MCTTGWWERYYDWFHHYHLTHSYIHKQHSCNKAPDRKLLQLSNTGVHICIPLVATIRILFVPILKYSSKGIYIKLYKYSCSVVLFLMCLQQLLYLTEHLNICSITLHNIVSGWLFKKLLWTVYVQAVQSTSFDLSFTQARTTLSNNMDNFSYFNWTCKLKVASFNGNDAYSVVTFWIQVLPWLVYYLMSSLCFM